MRRLPEPGTPVGWRRHEHRRDSPDRSARSVRVPAWDLEADVVVVGLGAAGASAAIEAAEAGAGVLVLEREFAGGGTSALSGGSIYLGGGTPLQRACGFDDTPEEMYRYLRASVQPGPERRVAARLLRR